MAPHTGSVTKLPTPPKSSFASDNVAGAHPLVLDAIAQANAGHVPAYGADPITVRTEQAFKELFDHDVVTQFAYGGTGANVFGAELRCRCKPDLGDHAGSVLKPASNGTGWPVSEPQSWLSAKMSWW